MTNHANGRVVPLSEALDQDEYGGKASALAHALLDGYRVPDGVVIGRSMTRAYETKHNDRAGALDGIIDRLGTVAVRSSGVAEDGVGASFAGQYETILHVSSERELEEAVRRCIASASSTAVTSYAETFHEPSDTAVLIQRMLQPSAAGVAFSVDPVTGHNHVVVQATQGVGDALLAGEETGERWIVAVDATCEGTPTALDASTVTEVADLCRALAEREGSPVDIEWAIDDGALHLLQVRPITAVPLEPTEHPPAGMTYVREPRFDQPMTPLSFTTWLPRHGDIFRRIFEQFGWPAQAIDNRHYYGRVYGRMVPLLDRGKDGPPPPPLVLRLLLQLVPSMRKRLSAAKEWDGDTAIRAMIDRWESEGREATRARTGELRSRELASMDDSQLAHHLEEINAHIDEVAFDHFSLSAGAGLIPTGRLGIVVEELLGWSIHEVITLVQGYGQSSVEHGRDVQELLAALGSDGVSAVLEDPSQLLASPEAEPYLEKHGHRVNVELTRQTEAEDPQQIADHLRRRLNAPDGSANPKAQAHELEQTAHSLITDETDRARFDAALDLARLGRPYGDETEVLTLDAVTLVRFVALEAGRRFAEAGRLGSPKEVWYLEQTELRDMLLDPVLPAPNVNRRRREYQWALANPAPDILGPPPAPPPPLSAIPRHLRSTVGAGFWALAAHDPEPEESDHSDGVLRGIPGSPGRSTGTARVIRSESDFGRIEPADIVVCPITVAAWSPIFGSISGLVTERGGPLSHPATLAREYGLPAVLAVSEATTLLSDGDRIEIDGAAGSIRRI